MKFYNYILTLLLSIGLLITNSHAQVMPGADQFGAYIPDLQGKKVGIVANQTSQVNGTSLIDTLLHYGIKIDKIFSPEHGFRGTADAGESVKDGRDTKTGIQVISLYGDNRKPKPNQIKGLDIMVFDLQDVGARFYTYISTLEYVMEACATAGIPLLILDRPNPMGHVVDGPVLKAQFKSFVGMQPIPILHGLTVAEYAQMLIGEKWLNTTKELNLLYVPVRNYTHQTKYDLPISPSPNLKNMAAIYLYTSTCFFEGTPISLGRGTDYPFQMYGHPAFRNMPYSFKPISMPGARKPPLQNQKCNGRFISNNAEEAYMITKDGIVLDYLIEAYKAYPNKANFFTSFFNLLAGTNELQAQIKKGMSAEAIKKTWQKDLENYKTIRAKYLIYP